MGPMVSSSQNSEFVFREEFIAFLLKTKGFPKGLLTKEMPLSFLQCTKGHRRDRRVDILVMTKGTLVPLLLIECKKSSPNMKASYQLLGYNLHVQAPWCALVWPEGFLIYDRARKMQSGPIVDFPAYEYFISSL